MCGEHAGDIAALHPYRQVSLHCLMAAEAGIELRMLVVHMGLFAVVELPLQGRGTGGRGKGDGLMNSRAHPPFTLPALSPSPPPSSRTRT